MEKPMAIESEVCTVLHAVSGVCGKPAVSSFVGRMGERFFECAEHDMSAHAGAAPSSVPEVGDWVTVRHIGIDKLGQVVKVGRVGVLVEVPIHGGEAAKVIRRRFEEILR